MLNTSNGSRTSSTGYFATPMAAAPIADNARYHVAFRGCNTGWTFHRNALQWVSRLALLNLSLPAIMQVSVHSVIVRCACLELAGCAQLRMYHTFI